MFAIRIAEDALIGVWYFLVIYGTMGQKGKRSRVTAIYKSRQYSVIVANLG